MNAIIAALLSVPPSCPDAFGLLAELMTDQEKLTVDVLILESAEIQAAENDLLGLAQRSKMAVERCLKLKPVPSPVAPVGF